MSTTAATTTTTTAATNNVDFFTNQLKQLMLEKDQLFQQYFELLSFDPIICKDKYKNDISILMSKIAVLKKRHQHIKFLLTQSFLQQAKANDNKEWTEQEEQQLVKEFFIDKINIQKICILHMRTPFIVQNKIKQIKKFYDFPFIADKYDQELLQNCNMLKNDKQYLFNFSIKCQRSPEVILNKIKQLEKDKLTSQLLTTLFQN
jgi:hypothetical protein